jgi:hypothetical protein
VCPPAVTVTAAAVTVTVTEKAQAATVFVTVTGAIAAPSPANPDTGREVSVPGRQGTSVVPGKPNQTSHKPGCTDAITKTVKASRTGTPPTGKPAAPSDGFPIRVNGTLTTITRARPTGSFQRAKLFNNHP